MSEVGGRRVGDAEMAGKEERSDEGVVRDRRTRTKTHQ